MIGFNTLVLYNKHYYVVQYWSNTHEHLSFHVTLFELVCELEVVAPWNVSTHQIRLPNCLPKAPVPYRCDQ